MYHDNQNNNMENHIESPYDSAIFHLLLKMQPMEISPTTQPSLQKILLAGISSRKSHIVQKACRIQEIHKETAIQHLIML